MNVGLPGTGLGSLLYIVLAVTMPIRLLYRMARRTAAPGEWRRALRLAALAGGVLLAIWATGAALNGLLQLASGEHPHGRSAVAGAAAVVGTGDDAFIRVSAIVLTAVALAGLLLLVEVLRLLFRSADGRGRSVSGPPKGRLPDAAEPRHEGGDAGGPERRPISGGARRSAARAIAVSMPTVERKTSHRVDLRRIHVIGRQ